MSEVEICCVKTMMWWSEDQVCHGPSRTAHRTAVPSLKERSKGGNIRISRIMLSVL